jgi:Fe-S-cluster-containing dehydrogenase component
MAKQSVSPEDQHHLSTSRRRFLSKAFLAGAGIVAGTSAGKLIHFSDDVKAGNMKMGASTVNHGQWVMVMDLRECDGCEMCTYSCQKAHNLKPEQTWIKVYTMTDAAGKTYHMPRTCMECDNSPCLRACPVGASFRSPDGVVLVDQNRCIGCRLCMAACPYEARYFNWDEPNPAPARMPMPTTPEYPFPQKQGTVGKCTLCSDRLPYGQLPHCVEGCPMGVLYIGDRTTDVAVNGKGKVVKLSSFLADNDAVRYKEELNTDPRVYYILGHGQALGN